MLSWLTLRGLNFIFLTWFEWSPHWVTEKWLYRRRALTQLLLLYRVIVTCISHTFEINRKNYQWLYFLFYCAPIDFVTLYTASTIGGALVGTALSTSLLCFLLKRRSGYARSFMNHSHVNKSVVFIGRVVGIKWAKLGRLWACLQSLSLVSLMNYTQQNTYLMLCITAH